MKLVPLGNQVPKEHVEILVMLERKELKEGLVLMEQMDNLVLMANKVPKDQRD